MYNAAVARQRAAMSRTLATSTPRDPSMTAPAKVTRGTRSRQRRRG